MNDRRLLLSLLALPACGPSVPPAADDPRVPDGGEPEKIESSCKASYQAMVSCYEELGYGSSGSGYGESSGAYDPGVYIEAACAELEEYAAMYGPGCAGAYEEVFACLASLDCSTMLDWQSDEDAFVPEPCEAVYRDASERCPEGFPQCGVQELSFGSGCEVTASSCLDGNTYGFRCSEPGVTQSCECEVNGEAQQTVMVGGGLDCGTEELFDEVADACGFPAGVF